MSDARGHVLSRLRAAQRTARLPVVAAGPQYATPRRTNDQCLARFVDELALLAVETHVATSADEVRARVAAALAGRRVLSWDPGLLPYDLASVVGSPLLGSSPRAAQAEADVGLTACEAAIAETGSLALLSGPGRSRAVSLLPPLHVAVVRRADLVFSMGEFLRDRAERIAAAANCTFVTGPSRTADIELTLTLGVHGPGAVIVVIGP